ncbi:MAG: hypothetical protein PHU25_11080 [Deltaproteobacteria bacterium]|nr:hypothetical protein [Deltaproteobacteria bacterium]
MSKPITLCVELENNPDSERYYKCTAQVGRDKGLTIQLDGTIGWCATSGIACELWVSRDQRLMAFRPPGVPEIHVSRAHRRILLAEKQMAILLHRDGLSIGGRSYRIHIHGVAESIHPPRLVKVVRAASLAASLTLGAASLGCGGPDPASKDAASDAAPTDTGTGDGGCDADTDTSSDTDFDTDTGCDTDTGTDTGATDTETMTLDSGIDAGDDAGPIDTNDTPPAAE